ncbi:hypothetical protein BB559_006157 [Furculomyces boomerangus]|uniref:Methyltransferase small domain-containing protein n=1 Tax=Furculomyces boomerangus TaxID=61424 RepID=A0A2T9Y4A5_9FUNG|nr:hypothetical protein BB559_006157 [Furculomyces boomerangus]
MKLKQLESYLQNVENFDEPKIEFEQYPTTPHLASRIIYTAENVFQDIQGKTIADLGCGCGMLTIASLLMEADFVTGIDIDKDAIEILQNNLDEYEISESAEIICANLSKSSSKKELLLDTNLLDKMHKKFDTVVMNPPFGTKPGNAGIDMLFLEAAVYLSKGAIYSLHKSSTRDYIIKTCKKWGYSCEVLAQLKFDIPKMYNFHKKNSVDINVDLIPN